MAYSFQKVALQFLALLRERLSLLEDKADDAVIDESIRAGVSLKGTNLWVLMFAIMIASVGLNVNSTAVIIGAMLISPLMGPIMGIGYGIGIYDLALIKKSLRNLAIATGISLFVSTLYFTLTPLTDAHSELLARTTPTIWDVLIALFGGLAGMIGATRAEKTNIIPGVAIATALMPPLCTVGYGVANANPHFFLGAFYLYAINCVFIAFSAVLITWILNPAHKQFVDTKTEIRMRRLLSTVVVLTMLPSVYLATNLVREEVYTSKAKAFVKAAFISKEAHIELTDLDPRDKHIAISVLGKPFSEAQIASAKALLPNLGLAGTSLELHQNTESILDVNALKTDLLRDLYQANLNELTEQRSQNEALKARLAKMEHARDISQSIQAELQAQEPSIIKATVAHSDSEEDQTVIVLVTTSKPLPKVIRERLAAWLKIRLTSEELKLITQTAMH